MSRSTPVIVILAALALISCGGGSETGEGEPSTNDLGPVHVHGLGVDPADGALYTATHTGLFRIPEGENEATRVGDSYQDTMGFTVVGPNRFLGSGHPDLRTELPPYLGLIESNDAGNQWRPRSLLGRVDFHVLEAVGQHIYGFGSDFETREERFLVSRDGGRRWERLDFPEALVSLAVNPSAPDELVGSGSRALYSSTDAGESWQPASGEPGLLSWPDPGPIYLLTPDGRVATTADVGSAWQFQGEIGGEPAAFEAAGPEDLHAALHDGSIMESSDGGETWTLRSEP